MKVAQAEKSVMGARGLEETGKFNIRASAHAFKVLSSGLYSDKVRAVLREIGCNAVDAHIAAGDPSKPFRVKLPNRLDEQFYVQDWGTGLSHEEVMNLYTTYFASTKQSSNDFTGAFGLGSKSPFSYTDHFTVVSTHAGRKRTYSLYIGDDGAPVVSLMAEEDPEADWARGVRVGFAVKPEHYAEFVAKATEVYQWFRVPPEMRGSAAIAPVKYRYECDDFGLLAGQHEQGTVHVLMGNVHYPLDLGELKVVDTRDKAASRDLINYVGQVRGLVIKLPLGSVQPTASREALDYVPATVRALKEAGRLAMRRLGKELVDKLQAATRGGWVELCACSNAVDDMAGGIRYNLDGLMEALGVEAKDIPILDKYVGKQEVQIPTAKVVACSCYIVRRRTQGNPKVSRRGEWDHGKLDIDPKTAIMAGPEERAQSRALRAVSEGKFDQVVVVGRGSTYRPEPHEIAAAAKMLSDAGPGIPIVEMRDYEPFDLAPGVAKKRKPKGWVPSLPAGVAFTVWRGEKEDTAELKDVAPLFICYAEKSRWNNTSSYARLYDKTLDDDILWDWGDWKQIWREYIKLQTLVKLPGAATSYAVLSAAQIKSIGIQRLGWKLAPEAVKSFLARPDLQVALRATIKKKGIAADQSIGNSGPFGWMTSLAAWHASRKDSAADLLLKRAGLLRQVQDMVETRAELAKTGGGASPPAINAYTWLTNKLGVENAVASDVRKALTVEDANAIFAKKYPRSQLVPVSALSSKMALDALEFILSKED